MKDLKHTPAPWFFEPDGNPEQITFKDGIIAHCRWEDGSPFGGVKTEQAEANAKLIASAPELLEALIIAKRKLFDDDIITNQEKEKILNAIKKATE